MSFYNLKEFIDWEKVEKSFQDENQAIKALKEDYSFYEEREAPDGTIEVIWGFRKWLKSETVNLDKVIKELSKYSRYNKK